MPLSINSDSGNELNVSPAEEPGQQQVHRQSQQSRGSVTWAEDLQDVVLVPRNLQSVYKKFDLIVAGLGLIRWTLVVILLFNVYFKATYYNSPSDCTTGTCDEPGTYSGCKYRENLISTFQLNVSDQDNNGHDHIPDCPNNLLVLCSLVLAVVIWIGEPAIVFLSIRCGGWDAGWSKHLLDILYRLLMILNLTTTLLLLTFLWIILPDPYHFCDDNQENKWIWKGSALDIGCIAANEKIYEFRILIMAMVQVVVGIDLWIFLSCLAIIVLCDVITLCIAILYPHKFIDDPPVFYYAMHRMCTLTAWHRHICWLLFTGTPLGKIIRRVRRNTKIQIQIDSDNIQAEAEVQVEGHQSEELA